MFTRGLPPHPGTRWPLNYAWRLSSSPLPYCSRPSLSPSFGGSGVYVMWRDFLSLPRSLVLEVSPLRPTLPLSVWLQGRDFVEWSMPFYNADSLCSFGNLFTELCCVASAWWVDLIYFGGNLLWLLLCVNFREGSWVSDHFHFYCSPFVINPPLTYQHVSIHNICYFLCLIYSPDYLIDIIPILKIFLISSRFKVPFDVQFCVILIWSFHVDNLIFASRLKITTIDNK